MVMYLYIIGCSRTSDEEIKHADLTNTTYCAYGAAIKAVFLKPTRSPTQGAAHFHKWYVYEHRLVGAAV